MKNILICFGTRPEAIKMAMLCKAFDSQKIQYKLCVTAQHREMLDQVLNFFDLKPDYDLNLMKSNHSLNELSSRILKEMDGIYKSEHFDLVLVHGDTTTSMIVALSAFYSNIHVGHIEAGLRTFDKNSPFPEEINRQLTGRIADYHFAPTIKAKANLIKEGVKLETILVTGNTVIDALEWTMIKLKSRLFASESIKALQDKIDFSKKIILVTGHRRESFGVGFTNICNALKTIANQHSVEIIFPVHLNPQVKNTVFNLLSDISNIHLIDPLDYPSFVWLMSRADLIISDSGGIQEEAPTLGVPVIVTRKTSERAEGLEAGCSYLAGTDIDLICKYAEELLDKQKQEFFENPYGDGKACKRIAKFIISNF
ncbi:MAG: UDP-N-acetylglucosamine 2-epimerase (non-hydrolyzing) [Cytophagaceae bacterium]|nr:UDP-N-acetylglucosamine 2-epimerase (non-hydrolyzing) [Cytophagaceae bacterium]